MNQTRHGETTDAEQRELAKELREGTITKIWTVKEGNLWMMDIEKDGKKFTLYPKADPTGKRLPYIYIEEATDDG